DECARDFEATIRRVGEIGFDGVELFDLHGRPAGEVRGLLDDAGLAVAGRHVGADADLVRTRAEEAGRHGLSYGFHNHWAELEPLEGSTTLDRIGELPVWLELDLGWVWWAGADPVDLLERFRGRTPLVHVKDLRERASRAFTPVGEGGV